MMTQYREIKHLYWRAGFGLSPDEWQGKKNQLRSVAIDELFREARERQNRTVGNSLLNKQVEKPDNKEAKRKLKKEEKRLVLLQNVDWVERMADPKESALLEKMSLFWHGHFACITKGSKLAYQQLNTIRQHALGSFRDLLHAMAKDVSMIRFLNNQQNKKAKPNENFAREVLELFTIGRGHYTEADIKAAARAFTGWSSNFKGVFRFKKRQHDYGTKTFMGRTGNFDGGDIINIILEQRATAAFITRKIYRFFINEKIDEKRLQVLARQFYDSDYNIEKLLRNIFSSDWFYDASNVGTRIKSPVELIAGVMRSLGVTFDRPGTLFFVQKALGQVLFHPPNVAGWGSDKNWIDNSTLLLRLNLVAYLFQAVEINFKNKETFEAKGRNKAIRKIKAKVNLQPLLNQFSKTNLDESMDQLSGYLLAGAPPLNRSLLRQYTIDSNSDDFTKSLTLRLMSLPEYQLC